VADRSDPVPVPDEPEHLARQRRQGHRLASGRSALHQGRVFPAAAVGGLLRRYRVDVFWLWRVELCAARPRRPCARPNRHLRERDKKGQLVAPDVEAWFQADKAGGNPHIIAQWAAAHNSLAQGWITGDSTHGAYVDAWAKAHDDLVKDWIKKNPTTPQPKASDLAALFFETFSNDHPGMFPSSVTNTGADGKPVTNIEPVNSGSDIQSIFFDMWRADHPDVALNDVPGDLVTASASGLDPDITLANAEFQLDRVAAKSADDEKLKADDVRKEIEGILEKIAYAPRGGLIGEKLVNVLDVNLEPH